MHVTKRRILMIKALFFDIDGTLVSFRTHTIPASAVDALKALRQKGMKVFINTGRPRVSMLKAVGHLEFDGYITLNGAHVFTSQHTDIYKDRIPREDIERLVDYHAQHPDIPFVFVNKSGWIITAENADVRQVAALVHETIPPIRPIEEALNREVLQIIGYFPKEKDSEVFSQALTHCTPMRWHPLFADIIASGNSKSRGIDIVAQHYGFRLEETMAFGDGGNDMSMLRHAGVGVAMGNAAPEVQASADYVTTEVDDDGIVNALRHFGLL